MNIPLKKTIAFLLSVALLLPLSGCRIVYKVSEKETERVYYDDITVEDGDVTDPSTESGQPTAQKDSASAGKKQQKTDGGVTDTSADGTSSGGKTSGKTDKSADNRPEKKPEKVAPEKKLSGSLKIQVFINESQNPSDAWTEVADAFEEATGVNVTLIMGSQVNTQYSARWLAGEAPADMILISGNGLPDEQMAKSGTFYDLSDTIKNGRIYGTSEKIADQINMNIIESENGKIFRAPLMTSVQGLWYNKNVIKTAPRNYDEFKAISKKQKSGLTYPGQYADYSTWALFMPAVAAYGQDFFDQVASGKPSAYKDSRFLAVLSRYKDYCDAKLVLTGSSSADHMTSQLNWLNGKCGFITNGLWLESEMHDYIPSDFHMAFMASPLIEKNQTPTVVLNSVNLAVASKAQNLENAKAFIRFIYREDMQLAFMSRYSYASALKSVNYGKANLTAVARETMDYIYSDKVKRVNKGVRWNDLINNEFKNVINDMTNGKMTVKQASEALYNAAKKAS